MEITLTRRRQEGSCWVVMGGTFDHYCSRTKGAGTAGQLL